MLKLDVPVNRRRASPEGVQERRKALALARPFSDRLEAWQMQLVRLRAAKLSTYSNDDDQLQARLGLGDLADEVVTALRELETGLDGRPAGGAVLDVRMAMRRLMQQIDEQLRT
jgi:hypothetical protein